jgi:hypothetical protein
MTPGQFDSLSADVAGDNIFLYGSGNFTLKAGESRRFSIALLVGDGFDDLTLNAKTARQIYDTNYQFAKPPEKPKLTAVPGNEKVTLYWDDIAESSWDPISKEYDFEGYVIYRSTDPSFLDQQNITDVNGSRFLFEPHTTETGGWAKWDLINEYEGPSDIPYSGRGVAYHLGNNTGLVHSFVDSNNVINGQRYYYAICSYDHGNKVLGIGPSESSKTITLNPETNEIFLDINTASVIPREPAAGYSSGYVADYDTISTLKRIGGFGTGDFAFEILDPMVIQDTNTFQITFKEFYSSKSFRFEGHKVLLVKLDKNNYFQLGTIDIHSQVCVAGDNNEIMFSYDLDIFCPSRPGIFDAFVSNASGSIKIILPSPSMYPSNLSRSPSVMFCCSPSKAFALTKDSSSPVSW